MDVQGWYSFLYWPINRPIQIISLSCYLPAEKSTDAIIGILYTILQYQFPEFRDPIFLTAIH